MQYIDTKKQRNVLFFSKKNKKKSKKKMIFSKKKFKKTKKKFSDLCFA